MPVLLGALGCPVPTGPPPAPPAPVPFQPGRMFDSTVTVLQGYFYDTAFVRADLPALRAEFLPEALAAADADAERRLIRRFLERIPASHLAIMSRWEHADLMDELAGKRHVTLGMQLMEIHDRYFASMVLTGGPAYTTGIRDGDEIVAIDSVPTAQSPHLDWREDDVYLPDERDPPAHGIRLLSSPALELRVVPLPGDTATRRVTPAFYSALDATRASVRLIVRDSVRVGYIRWWYMYSDGLVQHFRAALQGPLWLSDVLVLDLRGRGGSEAAVNGVLRLLGSTAEKRTRPVVALIDRQTRSAKEELAYELRRRGLGRLVGEPTAGAFIPASWVQLSEDVVLMLPVTDKKPNPYTPLIEGHPVEPDIAAPWIGPHSAGRDTLLEVGIAEAVRLVLERGPGKTVAPK